MKETIRPKKSLGQNFLKDTGIVQKIIDAASLKPDDFVIEIGPGTGVLTEKLAEKAKAVLAIEIDNILADNLKEKFKNNKKIEIINEDILNINLKSQIADRRSSYKVIANLPYYITSKIIRLFLEAEFPPKEMILMVQKEVAERIISNPGKMSLLAVSVQYYARSELLFPVSRNCFYPVPEVDSAVIRVTHTVKYRTQNTGKDKRFFRVVKAGFSAKRKTLLNNLSSSLHLEKIKVAEKLKAADISPTARAQELSIDDWKKLTISFS